MAEEEIRQEDDESKTGWQKLWKKDNVVKIIVLLGIAGIGMIFLSSMLHQTGKSEEIITDTLSDYETAALYREQLCEELGNMVASIQGTGKTKIMLTLEGTIRCVYATDQDIQKNESVKPGEKGEDQSIQNNEKKSCIVVRRSDGSEQALLIGQLMPKVSGVLIVCEGGDQPSVSQSVTHAVASALGIAETHICVLKMNS